MVHTTVKNKNERVKAIYNKTFFTLLILDIFGALLLSPYKNYDPMVGSGHEMLFNISIGMGIFFLVGYILSSSLPTKTS